MKARINLMQLDSSGSIASITNGEHDYIAIVTRRRSMDGKSICLLAAQRLRQLADDFDRLAAEEQPFLEATQKRVSGASK